MAPAFTALMNRVVVNSQRVSPSPCCRAGNTRNIPHNSVRARLTAESVTSRPISGTRLATVIAPFSLSSSNTLRASGVTLTVPAVSGGRFHPLSPRRVKTNGNAELDTTKSGLSPGPPSRFSGKADPSPINRANSPRAVSASAGVVPVLAVPRVASTREGAGAPNGRGANRISPCWLTKFRAASSVSNAPEPSSSFAWCHDLARAAAICDSFISGVVDKTSSYFRLRVRGKGGRDNRPQV